MGIRAHRNNAGYRRALNDQEINDLINMVDDEDGSYFGNTVRVNFMSETGRRRVPYRRAA